MTSRLDGLEFAYALFDGLPAKAQAELGTTLDEIGQAVLGEQRKALEEQGAVRTGGLKGALTVEEAVNELRVRIGLMSRAMRKFFYGKFVERGRRAQVVRVTRGTAAGKRPKANRFGAGGGRVVAPAYNLRVRAMRARPFIHIESRIEAVTRGYVDRFWAKVLS